VFKSDAMTIAGLADVVKVL